MVKSQSGSAQRFTRRTVRQILKRGTSSGEVHLRRSHINPAAAGVVRSLNLLGTFTHILLKHDIEVSHRVFPSQVKDGGEGKINLPSCSVQEIWSTPPLPSQDQPWLRKSWMWHRQLGRYPEGVLTRPPS